MHPNTSRHRGGFFSFDAAVAALCLILIAHAAISLHARSSSLSLASSRQTQAQLSAMQIADWLAKEGAAELHESPSPASQYALHHELAHDWDLRVDADSLASRMRLSYLSISAGGSEISSGQQTSGELHCASRLALLGDEITLLRVCCS